MRNTGFYGFTSTFVLQLSLFLTYATAMYFYLFGSNMFDDIDQMEIVVATYFIIIRCLIISYKYATLPTQHLEYYKTGGLIPQFIQNDLFINWLSQNQQIMVKELTYSLQRDNMDQTLFTFEFFYPLDIKTNERIEKKFKSFCEDYELLTRDLKLFRQPFPTQMKSSFFRKKQLYHGFSIMSELNIIYMQNSLGSTPVMIICGLTAITRIFFAYLARYLQNKPILGDTPLVGFTMICNSYPTLFLGFINYYLLIYGVQDVQRKLYYLIQASLLMQIQKNQNEKSQSEKALPTINVLSIQSIKSWGMLRRIMIDYGMGYQMRYQAMLLTFLLFNLSQIVFLVLNALKVVKISLFATMVNIFDSTLTISVILIVLFYIAQINNHILLHQQLLEYNRDFFQQFYRYEKTFFNEDYQTSNIVYKEIIQRIRKSYPHKKERLDFLRNLKLAYVDVKEMLEYDGNVRPFKLVGITVNMQMLVSIAAGAGTAIAAAVFATIKQRLKAADPTIPL